MSKEYLDKDRLKIEFHKLGHYTDQTCKEFLVHNVNKLITQICQLKPKNQDKKMKKLEEENKRLRKLLSEINIGLDKLIKGLDEIK